MDLDRCQDHHVVDLDRFHHGWKVGCHQSYPNDACLRHHHHHHHHHHHQLNCSIGPNVDASHHCYAGRLWLLDACWQLQQPLRLQFQAHFLICSSCSSHHDDFHHHQNHVCCCYLVGDQLQKQTALIWTSRACVLRLQQTGQKFLTQQQQRRRREQQQRLLLLDHQKLLH